MKILSLFWHFSVAFNTPMQIILEANHTISTPDITFLINLHHRAPSPAIPTPNVFFWALCVRAGAEPQLAGWVGNKWKIKSCWILYLYLFDARRGQMGVFSSLTGYSNRKMRWFWSRKHPNRVRRADLHLRPHMGHILSHRLGAASVKVSTAKTGNVPSLSRDVGDGLSCSHGEKGREKIYYWYPLKSALSGGKIFMNFILANAKNAPNP